MTDPAVGLDTAELLAMVDDKPISPWGHRAWIKDVRHTGCAEIPLHRAVSGLRRAAFYRFLRDAVHVENAVKALSLHGTRPKVYDRVLPIFFAQDDSRFLLGFARLPMDNTGKGHG